MELQEESRPRCRQNKKCGRYFREGDEEQSQAIMIIGEQFDNKCKKMCKVRAKHEIVISPPSYHSLVISQLFGGNISRNSFFFCVYYFLLDSSAL